MTYESKEPNTNEEEVARFFQALGGGSRLDLADPTAEDDDVTYEKSSEVRSFKVSALIPICHYVI
jgi:hypothetical protein